MCNILDYLSKVDNFTDRRISSYSSHKKVFGWKDKGMKESIFVQGSLKGVSGVKKIFSGKEMYMLVDGSSWL